MPNIQETLVKAVSIRGGEILKDKKILCNILEDLSPDLYSTIAFINKIYTSAVGEMLFKAYSAKNEQRKTYIKEADRILEEEEDRGSKSRKAFFSYFEFLIIQGDTEQKVPAKDKTSIWMKDGVAAFANAVNGRKAKLEGSSGRSTMASGQNSGNTSKPDATIVEDGYVVQNNSDGSVTEGYKKNGVWNGPYTKTYLSGVMYKGTCVNGEVEGELTYVDKNGNTFICEWHNGNWNGDGVYRSKDGILTGKWVEGEVIGTGVYKYNNGRVYEGGIKNFMREGKGVIKFLPNDITLTANFKDNAVIGYATIVFPGGDTYVGSWNGNISGHGKFTSTQCMGIQNITYDGEWKDGMLSGSGCRLTIVSNRVSTILYDGDFAFGKANGNGYLYECDKSGFRDILIFGKWQNNEVASKSKSRIIKDGEGMIANAVEYIRNVTVKC